MSLSHIAEELSNRFGERFTRSKGICLEHGTDISHFKPQPPDGVVFAQSASEIADILRLCMHSRTPVVPYGAGTSVEGNIHALHDGLCIDLSRMNKVVKVNAADLDAIVQPGVRRLELNSYLRDSGLFFPVDPGADATLGGMVSTRASGTNAVKYGTMKDNVLGLKIVTPQGEIVRTSRRARKSSAGYDLTRLMVGSEGTLGIISELTLNLYGVPEKIVAAVCAFSNLSGAVGFVIACIQSGVPLARIELLDEQAILAINDRTGLELPGSPVLFLEFHGTEASIGEHVALCESVMGEMGGSGFRWAEKPEERSMLWKARHEAAQSIASYAKGIRQWWTDVCVPISRLADCILETKEDIKRGGLYCPILGHVGDGNFHVGICAREDDLDEMAAASLLHERLVERALHMDGTCTGEHGIGRGKREFLVKELGPAVGLMRSIKQALDPAGIMNPGKIFQ